MSAIPAPSDHSDALRVSVLSEALPYIQRFAGRRVVVKYGGAAMAHEDLRDAVYRDLALQGNGERLVMQLLRPITQ